ncbi:GNAT family N-acetyltransferase [Amphritea japonica]|uniref:Acetyltransferase n=1 Tax=Amphritea japonica ATCC BAA-1530 TaxID=1278309 RepID=A0A7R6STE2_9GAMM|nr:N-acetyltransferase [Amphritea japonica]BBB26580.1 acetyltransferase [Amphritea japonica ATCC BAA-1530]
MEVVRADLSHVAEVARLFDSYRQFYDCKFDRQLAFEFIQSRIENNESVIFLALDNQGKGLGFTQLYPSFCSVEAIKIFILYDLYVDTNSRKMNIGRSLMEKAREHAKETRSARIDLLTDKNNYSAKKLYEKLGYTKTNESFHSYSLVVQLSTI